jgi:hypothetical protein
VVSLVVAIYPILRIKTSVMRWRLIKRVYKGEYGIIASICIWMNTVCFMINLGLAVSLYKW